MAKYFSLYSWLLSTIVHDTFNREEGIHGRREGEVNMEVRGRIKERGERKGRFKKDRANRLGKQ